METAERVARWTVTTTSSTSALAEFVLAATDCALAATTNPLWAIAATMAVVASNAVRYRIEFFITHPFSNRHKSFQVRKIAGRCVSHRTNQCPFDEYCAVRHLSPIGGAGW
jgi:hypothetical protein